ncbi:DUF6612 family protein [Dehalogenimonas etheniformans]|nr:DUF6612 family protein [Dehalogenimonas etheniformans]QNT76917.1 hypothetical protein HX448_09640 [Dehalogenimonas etheniformans]
MIRSKILSILAGLALIAIIASSCGGNDTASPPPTSNNPVTTTTSSTTNPPTTTPPPTTPAPDVLLKLINTASAGMNTFEGSLSTNMSMNLFGMDMKIDMTGTMAVDKPGKKLFTVITGSSSGFGETVAMNEQMYLINDTMYIKGEVQDSGMDPNTWYKQVLPATDLSAMWTSQDIGSQIQILLDSAALQIVGTESIGGVQCYKLKINPNMDKFMSYLGASGSDLADMGIANAAQAFKQLDVTIWVSTASYLPAKMDMALGLNVDSQGQTMTITMVLSQTFNKVNQPVNITLPTAAQNAVTLPA